MKGKTQKDMKLSDFRTEIGDTLYRYESRSENKNKRPRVLIDDEKRPQNPPKEYGLVCKFYPQMTYVTNVLDIKYLWIREINVNITAVESLPLGFARNVRFFFLL
ncbi:hypothetical protein NPIL_199691 [Nephila pilipes]|uniref:Uncharacterized protein n=1 Tax=Nephila pilipes TaxID=299642 RepID=A0A8X6TM84_NEPPI|nr:hypothetical protein NPIL_199691 [Nephila pilipes]